MLFRSEGIEEKIKGHVKVNCPDGRIMDSLGMCGTLVTCPEGARKCWNGACALPYEKCDTFNLLSSPREDRQDECDGTSLYECDTVCITHTHIYTHTHTL